MSTLTPTAATEIFRHAPDRFVPVEGGEVAVRTVGSGPDVVLVHGWPVSGATFRQVLPRLAEHVTCHIIDLVGAGQSRFDRSTPIGLDLHVRSVQAVLDDLGSDSVAVVGHDSGGLVARHAVAGDDRLRGLGLVNTEPPPPLPPLFRAFLAAGRTPVFGAVFPPLVMSRRLRRLPVVLGGAFEDDALLDGDFEDLLLRPLRDDPDRRWAAVMLVRDLDRGYIAELPEVHRRITAPVGLVWGEGDPFFPVARARQMVDTFPDARLTVVPGARLFAHEERPAEVARALLEVVG